jgi:acetyl-CoA C-acetyltransferase
MAGTTSGSSGARRTRGTKAAKETASSRVVKSGKGAMQDVCVVAGGVRTPFTKAGTVQAGARAVDLGRWAVTELMIRTGADPTKVDELVAGNVIQPVDAVNIARVIALRAHLPDRLPGYTVHRNCASGIQAIADAHMLIASGRAQCVIALGVESMSDAPLLVRRQLRAWIYQLQRAKTAAAKARLITTFPLKEINPEVGILLGLTDPVSTLNMGQTAENVAREFSISREEQDELALISHQRTAAAWEEGRLKDEVMPTFPAPGFTSVAVDNGFRTDTSMERLAALRPVFDRDNGTVTAGNSSQVTDGACAVMLTSRAFAEAEGLEVVGTVKDFAFGGLDPSRMGLGPVFSTTKLFEKNKIGWDDLDLVELNEAFAAQAIACVRAFDSKTFYDKELPGSSPPGPPDWDKTNVNGGAVALGHPVGATGTRIVLTLINELNRRGGGRGLATLCVGGGQGASVLVEAAA